MYWLKKLRVNYISCINSISMCRLKNLQAFIPCYLRNLCTRCCYSNLSFSADIFLGTSVLFQKGKILTKRRV